MATKYVSSLTGPEMDAALIDMAYHNSEAYAVGTRNGVAVGSSDVTYHNNAKYYAEQTGSDVQAAEAAAARAEAAVPPSTAGAVFFDRAQALTDAQKGQAKANIGAGSTNPNLLDNAYFVGGGSQLGDGVFPINQRGQTQYTGGGVQLDRWHGWAGTDTIVLTANGLEYTSPSSNGLLQYFPVFPTTETVTFSAKIGGTIYSVTLPEGQNKVRLDQSTFGLTVDRNDKAVGIFSYNSTLLLQAAKLEVGTVSTLANDAPPDFGEELRKCQRYLWIKTFPGNTQLGSGIALTAGQAVVSVITPVPMRSVQNITFTANCLLVGNGQVLTVSAVTGINQYDNIARLILSSSGLTAYHTYSFFTTTETTMAIYAEL